MKKILIYFLFFFINNEIICQNSKGYIYNFDNNIQVSIIIYTNGNYICEYTEFLDDQINSYTLSTGIYKIFDSEIQMIDILHKFKFQVFLNSNKLYIKHGFPFLTGLVLDFNKDYSNVDYYSYDKNFMNIFLRKKITIYYLTTRFIH